MLRKFSVENYKSFKRRTTIDFTDVKAYQFNIGCIKDDLLNKVLLMGVNGSGKTNLGFALFDIAYTLTDNSYDLHQKDASSFLNGNSDVGYATFSYEFQQNGEPIVYEYRKADPENIVYEHLTVNDETIFKYDIERKYRNLDGLEKVNAKDLNINKLGGPLSLLRFIANNTEQNKDSPITFVMNFVKGMLYFRSNQDGNAYMGYTKGGEDIDGFIVRNGLVEGFQSYLEDVAGLKMKLSTVAIGNGMPEIFVENYAKKSVPFSFVASSGTKALELFYYWSRRFKGVTFLFIDEFDAFYHYELAREVLRRVLKYDSIQTVLTTHNTYLVDNDLMRPDCYLIINDGTVRSISDRTARELRFGHNLEKMLRSGEFDE